MEICKKNPMPSKSFWKKIEGQTNKHMTVSHNIAGELGAGYQVLVLWPEKQFKGKMNSKQDSIGLLK